MYSSKSVEISLGTEIFSPDEAAYSSQFNIGIGSSTIIVIGDWKIKNEYDPANFVLRKYPNVSPIEVHGKILISFYKSLSFSFRRLQDPKPYFEIHNRLLQIPSSI